MLTVLLYLVIMVLVGGLLYLAASMVFGRSEELPPLPAGTTATVLPAAGVTGADVQELRFQQTLRGYKASEVDWALDRLGREIDSLRAQLAERTNSGSVDGPTDADGPSDAEAGR